MIQFCLLTLLGLFVAYLFYIILSPMLELFLLKLKHGKEIEIEFMPIIGEAFFRKRSLKQHKDVLYHRRQILTEKPDVKVIASNYFLNQIALTFVDPQQIKQVFQAPELFRKYDYSIFNDLVFQKGLLYTEDQAWRDQRKIIGHQFTFENLKCRFNIIKEITRKNFEQFIKIDEDVKLLAVTSKITGEVLTQTFFGEEFGGNLVNGLSASDASVECLALQTQINTRSTWVHIRGIFFGYKSNIPRFLLTQKEKLLLSKLDNLKKLVSEKMMKREATFQQSEIENKDFVQIYLAESKKLNREVSLEELIQQFITFAFAGTDTTSALTQMACYVLSRNTNLQEQIRSQIQENVQSFANLTHNDLPKMDKLSALLQEVLRIYPPVARVIFREARQITKIGFYFNFRKGNFTLKPSYLISCNILSVQQDPKYYDKPDEFNINRWLNNDLKEPHAFQAFSSGPRNCIGQHMAMIEAKVMIIYILLKYKLLPDPKRQFVLAAPLLYTSDDDRLVHFQLL